MNIVRYEPRGAVRDLFLCRDPEILVEGPAGTGKTRGILEKLLICCIKYPGARILLLRKTRASMTESVLVTLEQHVIPSNTTLFPDVRAQQRRTRHSYEYPNGSVMVAAGMDNPERILSTEWDVIATFEGTELFESEYEVLLSRLGRNNKMPYSQAITDCNPGPTTHWLNQRANKGMMTRLRSRHQDNVMLYDAGQWTPVGQKYISTLERLSGVRRVRLLEGKWATAEGVVYPDFDPLIHVIPKFEIPKEWRRIRSIDFGYTNPFVCGWYGIDPDGRMFKYRELYGTGRLVEDWAKDILALSGDERYEVTISDHDAEDRATLTRHGVSTMAAFKGVTPGIQAVEARLRPAGDGKPRYFQMKDILVGRDEKLSASYKPTCSEYEWESYVWPKSVEGKPIKEEPVKENDHGMDELRYAVAYVDNIQFAPASVKISNGTPQPAKVPIFVSVNNGRGGWH